MGLVLQSLSASQYCLTLNICFLLFFCFRLSLNFHFYFRFQLFWFWLFYFWVEQSAFGPHNILFSLVTIFYELKNCQLSPCPPWVLEMSATLLEVVYLWIPTDPKIISSFWVLRAQLIKMYHYKAAGIILKSRAAVMSIISMQIYFMKCLQCPQQDAKNKTTQSESPGKGLLGFLQSMPVFDSKSLSVSIVTPLARSDSYSGVEWTWLTIRKTNTKWCALVNIINNIIEINSLNQVIKVKCQQTKIKVTNQTQKYQSEKTRNKPVGQSEGFFQKLPFWQTIKLQQFSLIPMGQITSSSNGPITETAKIGAAIIGLTTFGLVASGVAAGSLAAGAQVLFSNVITGSFMVVLQTLGTGIMVSIMPVLAGIGLLSGLGIYLASKLL